MFGQSYRSTDPRFAPLEREGILLEAASSINVSALRDEEGSDRSRFQIHTILVAGRPGRCRFRFCIRLTTKLALTKGPPEFILE